MDRRIGYGMDLRKAVEMGLTEAVQQGKVSHFSITTENHLVVWGELRDDGWRVYAPSITSDSKRTVEP